MNFRVNFVKILKVVSFGSFCSSQCENAPDLCKCLRSRLDRTPNRSGLNGSLVINDTATREINLPEAL